MTLQPRASDTQLRPRDHRLAAEKRYNVNIGHSVYKIFFICIRLRHTPLNSIAIAGVAGAQVAVAGVCGHGDAGTRLRLLVRHATAHSPDNLQVTNRIKDIQACFHVSMLLIFWGFLALHCWSFCFT